MVNDVGNLLNGKLLRAMAPHVDRTSRKVYIEKVTALQHAPNTKQADVLCVVKGVQRRNCFVSLVVFARVL